MGGRHRAHEWSLRDGLLVAVALVVGLVAAGLTQDAARSTVRPAGIGVARSTDVPELTPHSLTSSASAVDVVQALPGPPVEVEVDGKTVGQKVALGKVLGPLRLSAGMHQVRFIGATTTAASVTVTAGATHDVVLHAPAADGNAVVSVYRTPTAPIAQGKARVLLAHTAEVGAADIWVDGAKVFSKISNGQFAQADVPAGTHQVAIRPAGSSGKPVLGPLPVDLAEGTVTLAYAVGNPAAKGMSVVAHVERLEADGSVTPLRIHTGSAGLAGGSVRGFGSLPTSARGGGR